MKRDEFVKKVSEVFERFDPVNIEAWNGEYEAEANFFCDLILRSPSRMLDVGSVSRDLLLGDIAKNVYGTFVIWFSPNLVPTWSNKLWLDISVELESLVVSACQP